MKTLPAYAIIWAVSFPALTFSQSGTPLFSLRGEMPQQAPATARNGQSKRLVGESNAKIPGSGQAAYFLDSVQYLYGSNNQVSEKRQLQFGTNGWALTERFLFPQYDAQGNAVEEISQTTSDKGNTWVMQQRRLTAYSPTGSLKSLRIYQWAASTETWVETEYHFYDYDDQGNLEWESDNGQFFYFYYNDYSPEGLLLTIAKDVYINNWVVHIWRKDFQYNPAVTGQLLVSHTYSEYLPWDSADGLMDSTTYTFDAQGNLLVRDYVEPSYFETDCQLVHRSTDYFDAQHRLTKRENREACQMTDSTLHWQLAKVTNYFTDADGDPSYWLEHDYSVPGDSILLLHRYSYETVSGAQQPISGALFEVFPNPASSTIFLKAESGACQSANIYDFNGRLLKALVLNGLEIEAISLAGLPNGMYTIQVRTGSGQTVAKRFVVQD